MTPRSYSPPRKRIADAPGHLGEVDGLRHMGSDVFNGVSPILQGLNDDFLEMKSRVVGANNNAHDDPLSFYGSRRGNHSS